MSGRRLSEDSVWSKYIENNEYLNKKRKRNPASSGSMKEVIERDMTQGQSIQLGNGIEKTFTDIILGETSLRNMKAGNVKGIKETDHLFADHVHKRLYYAELKTNLNLDTEKSRATIEKCKQFARHFAKLKDYSVTWFLVCPRYLEKSEMPKHIMKKYMEIEDHVVGTNEYFKALGCTQFGSQGEYHDALNDMADKL
jgi:hypothetical protein